MEDSQANGSTFPTGTPTRIKSGRLLRRRKAARTALASVAVHSLTLVGATVSISLLPKRFSIYHDCRPIHPNILFVPFSSLPDFNDALFE